MRKILIAALLIAVWVGSASALVDVTSKVQIIRGAPTFNYVTNQTSVSLSVKNISSENLEIPIRVTIESISTSSVTCANASGTGDDGKPYFLMVYGTSTTLKPGETSDVKKVLLNNPTRARFNFTTKGYVSTPANTLSSFVENISNSDVDSAVKLLDENAKAKYLTALNGVFDLLPEFANDFNDATFIQLSDTRAKYELRVFEDGGTVIYDVYLVKDSKGEWKIYKF